MSITKCYSTLGIKYKGSFSLLSLLGNDDITGAKPNKARLDANTTWCTKEVDDAGLTVPVSTSDIEVIYYTAISIKVVPEQSGKVEYERKKLAGCDD